MDISNYGAKIMTSAKLRSATVVRLQIIPPAGAPARRRAGVAHRDADGVAVFFARSVQHPFIRAA